MASSNIFIMLTVLAIFVPSIMAKEYIVGDEKGWTINFDYQAWAQGKEFHVDDKLVFKYTQGAHNVLKVDGPSFQQCLEPAGVEALTTGNDVVTLATPGRKWYICGVSKHCESGNQKLFINVLADGESPAPSPSAVSPSSAPTGSTGSVYYGLMAVMVGFVAMVMV